MHGIDEQITKAEKAVAGQIPIEPNRFTQLSGDTHTANRELEARARALADLSEALDRIYCHTDAH
jgi:hypothetical protein